MEVNLVDRDMAQFRFGPFKVVPREKIITYLGQTSEYLYSLVLMQTGRSVCSYACGSLLIFIYNVLLQSNILANFMKLSGSAVAIGHDM